MKRLSHQDYQNLIESGEPLDPAYQAQLEAHLTTCPECRAFAAYHQKLLQVVPQAYPYAPLTVSQIRQMTGETKEKLAHRSAARRVFSGLGSAVYLGAAVLLMALLGYGLFRLLPEQNQRTAGSLAPTPAKMVTNAPLAAPSSTMSASYPQDTPSVEKTQPAGNPSPVITPTPAGPVSAANVQAELQAQSGGAINGVVVVENTTYVGLGPRVAAIDIRKPDKPQLTAQTEPLPGVVTRLLKLPGGLPTHLAAAAGNTLVTLEVSGQGEIAITGKVTLPGSVNSMLVDLSTQILYAAGQQAGNHSSGFIVSVDMSDPANPRLLAQTASPQVVTSLALSRGALYVGLSTSAQFPASVIVTTGAAPEKLEGFEPAITSLDSEIYSMSAVGSRLYVGAYMSMLAYDISDPLSPKQVWKVTEAGKNQPLSMVDGFELRPDYIYTAGLMPAGGMVYSRVAFAPPEPIQSSSMIETASIVAISNGQMYVTGDGLEIYAIGDHATLKQIGVFQPEQSLTFAVAVYGDTVYALQQASRRGNPEPDTLRVLRLPDLQEVSAIQLDHSQDRVTQWGWYRGMTIYGDRLYLFDGYGQNWIFDLTQPDQPVLLSRPVVPSRDLLTGTVGSSGNRLLMFQSFLASSDTQASTLSAYDVSDPQNVQALNTSITVPERVNRLVWNGTSLLALTEGPTQDVHTLLVLSFNNDHLALVGQMPLPGYGMSLTFWQDQAILTAGNQLVTVSLANPTQPAIRSQIQLPAANSRYDPAKPDCLGMGSGRRQWAAPGV